MMKVHEPAQPPSHGTRNGETRWRLSEVSIGELIKSIKGWHALIAGVVLLFSAVADLEGFLRARLRLAMFTFIVAVIVSALWTMFDRRPSIRSSHLARVVRVFATIVGVGMASTFGAYSIAPRFAADHAPTFAIARFDGPDLPKPYAKCRPSDVLADSLTDVANRFHRLRAFELPYSIEPDDRWADTWAFLHGWIQAANTVVYGEYSLVDRAVGSNKPDRVLISPHVNAVPFIPLGHRRAPLLQWQFNPRLVSIDQLCSGRAARFINDGHRLGLALSALSLFSGHEYVAAQRALAEAEDVSHELRPPDDHAAAGTPAPVKTSRCYGVLAEDSECSGVLAFYLAALEQRSGNYDRARSEYALAAKKLNRAPPYVNLAELYALQCDWGNVLLALNFAVWAEPSSVTALAARSLYEYEQGDPGETQYRALADIDLEQAQALKEESVYDALAVSRALHGRDEIDRKIQGIAKMGRAIRQGTGEKLELLDTRAEYAGWLLADRAAFDCGTKDHRTAIDGIDGSICASRPGTAPNAEVVQARVVDLAICTVQTVTDEQPENIQGNYYFALAHGIRQSMPAQSPSSCEKRRATQTNEDNPCADQTDSALMKCGYLRALSARAFTDEDYTTQGNAAADLHQFHRALTLYAQALHVNARAVYALSGAARVYETTGHYRRAIANYDAALRLHPHEAELRNALHEAQVQLAFGP
jgi:tetratricopeptide (TPR) repeat protein